jgi:hypothetical protein
MNEKKKISKIRVFNFISFLSFSLLNKNCCVNKLNEEKSTSISCIFQIKKTFCYYTTSLVTFHACQEDEKVFFFLLYLKFNFSSTDVGSFLLLFYIIFFLNENCCWRKQEFLDCKYMCEGFTASEIKN